ncbi:uncharacterized protein LOC134261918 [Saccostrea cucullata]|uniref:uncharacterized protein LOC134261918 n=1 Tax=Saccostrea cuccullata TaxID=36930 RepID=UPI002ED43110
MELEGQGKISPTEKGDLDPSECKKRPLSVGSGSSSSSSSLSHHVIKKPNLSSIDSSSSKLDHILYIDDEKGDQSLIQEKSVESSPDISVSDLSPNKNVEEEVETCKFVISPNQSHGVFIDQETGPKTAEDTSPQITKITKTAIETLSAENSESVSVSQNSLRLPSSHSSSPSISASECSSVVSVDNASSNLPPSQNTPTPQSRPPDSPTKYVTRVQRVISEIVDTERTYVFSLNEIIQVCIISHNA